VSRSIAVFCDGLWIVRFQGYGRLKKGIGTESLKDRDEVRGVHLLEVKKWI
jgi:hypothetical protein